MSTAHKGMAWRCVTLVLLLAAAPTLLAQSVSDYRVTHTYTLGGDGGWDYVIPDPPNHRLFIGRQNRVMVVDENDGRLLGEVTGINGAHGVALVEHTGHGFATSGNVDGTLTVIHQDGPDKYHVVENVQTAQGGRNMGLDPLTHHVFVVSARFGPRRPKRRRPTRGGGPRWSPVPSW